MTQPTASQPSPAPAEVEVPATLNGYHVIAHKPSTSWLGQFVVLAVDRRHGSYEYVTWITGQQKGYVGSDGDWVCHFGDYIHNLQTAVDSYARRT